MATFTRVKRIRQNLDGTQRTEAIRYFDGTNREAVKQLLSYHVLSGSLTKEDLIRQIKAGNGKTQLKTVSGGTLTASLGDSGQILLTDEQGGTAHLDATDYRQLNGVIYGLDNVLMPKSGVSAFR